jgi:hypothetical protein
LATDVSEVHAASIIRAMMEAARTSETSVDNYFTRQYIPEDKSELHTCRRENLKSHNQYKVCQKISKADAVSKTWLTFGDDIELILKH